MHTSSRRHAGRTAILFAALTALLVTGAPLQAEAAPPILRPATRGMFATFGFGPAIRLDDWPGQFQIEQAFGWHFNGTGSGPAIGVALAESFGGYWFTFNVGARFWYDIQPLANLGLYITPFGHLGFGLGSPKVGDSAATFNMIFGVEGRLALGNRGMVFFRPLSFEFYIGDYAGANFDARYTLLFGGGVYF
ncbi:MAG: hypothetical protein CSA65_02550 [Proteobacteria bacterium]|nr:MAG: hypothetical protein CSA65_02550 [Pseudomonadota bacterium]